MSLRHNNQGPHLLGSVCFKCWPLWNCLLLTVMVWSWPTQRREASLEFFFSPLNFHNRKNWFSKWDARGDLRERSDAVKGNTVQMWEAGNHQEKATVVSVGSDSTEGKKSRGGISVKDCRRRGVRSAGIHTGDTQEECWRIWPSGVRTEQAQV